MSDIAISVENLSKKFRIGTANSPSYHRASEFISGVPRAFWNAARSTLRRPKASAHCATPNDFWALQDVSFEVKQGEVVGIIGRNGAGKSTLLKILSRITEPTSGRFGIRGRVASLLEVGTGFHPELTGRENIFVSGITLGMSRAEIKQRFDEIVDFSGIERFLDTAVKQYSSGMQVRLGFAVAAHLESEILIVDEVLAVGDAEFQRKSIGKMGTISKNGRSVVFVSHNIPAIRTFCQQALWIDAGKIVENGNASDVLGKYASVTSGALKERRWMNSDSAPGNEHLRLHSARIGSSNKENSDSLTISTRLEFIFEFKVLTPGILWNPSVVIQTQDSFTVLNTFPSCNVELLSMPLSIGNYQCGFEVPENFLNDETYRVHLYMIRDRSIIEFRVEDILIVELADDVDRETWFGKWEGAVRPRFQWTASQLHDSQ